MVVCHQCNNPLEASKIWITLAPIGSGCTYCHCAEFHPPPPRGSCFSMFHLASIDQEIDEIGQFLCRIPVCCISFSNLDRASCMLARPSATWKVRKRRRPVVNFLKVEAVSICFNADMTLRYLRGWTNISLKVGRYDSWILMTHVLKRRLATKCHFSEWLCQESSKARCLLRMSSMYE